MKNSRNLAKGEECLIRIPGCRGGTETTVLCHYRLTGYSGMGLKPDDDLGAYGCDLCHARVDGRMKPPEGWAKGDLRLAHAEGVMRTWIRRKEQWEDK